MYIIGISAYYHDASACLFKDGQLMFACEEEKFTGIKHDSSFPFKTIEYIFKKFKICKKDISMVCYYETPNLKLERVSSNIKKQLIKNPIYSIKSYFSIKKNIKELNRNLKMVSNNVFFSKHHLAHLYYSFFTSPFDEAITLSVDGVGEKDTMSFGYGNKNGVEYTLLSEYPHSLGLFYSAMTSFLGFKPNEGEYKVMGLASYGNPEIYIEKVRKLINFNNTLLTCNMDVFLWDKSNKIMFNEKLPELLGIDIRLPEETIEQKHKDLAASIQKRYEEIFFDILKTITNITQVSNLCLSGGCAYNGTANGKIIRNTPFTHLWVPPAPSDAGSSIGACIHYLSKNNLLKNKITKNPFLGPEYYVEHEKTLFKGLKYRKYVTESGLKKFVAKELKNGKVVGWFQGHCEFGARALGNRSILANPTVKGMRDRINSVIKKREGFRPFAPMVIKEKQHQYFDMMDDVPYMNQVVKVKSEYVDKLDAVTHVDGTARVQTVYKNTLIYDLLIEFEKLSGYPILLNTSFNIKDKTMVLTPKDAVDTFKNTDIDILVINNYIIVK